MRRPVSSSVHLYSKSRDERKFASEWSRNNDRGRSCTWSRRGVTASLNCPHLPHPTLPTEIRDRCLVQLQLRQSSCSYLSSSKCSRGRSRPNISGDGGVDDCIVTTESRPSGRNGRQPYTSQHPPAWFPRQCSLFKPRPQ